MALRPLQLALAILTASTALAADPQDTRVLHATSIGDRAVGIERSHTLLLPEGWTADGGPLWTLQETGISHMVLALAAPDGSGVTFHRGGAASVAQSNLPVPQAASRLDQDSTPADVALAEILKRTRRGARGFRLVDEGTVKPLRRQYRSLLRDTARQIEQNGTRTFGGERSKTKVSLDVPSVRFTYRQGGEAWEEELFFYLMTVETENSTSLGGWYRTKVWNFSSPVSIRAKRGELDDQRALLYTVLNSVQATEEWIRMRHMMNVAVSRQRHQVRMATLEQISRAAREIARSDARVREQAAASWRRQDAARDAGQAALVDAIGGVEQYRMPDGTTLALDAGYQRAYADENGTVLLTNDVLNDPNVGSDVEWKPIRVIGR